MNTAVCFLLVGLISQCTCMQNGQYMWQQQQQMQQQQQDSQDMEANPFPASVAGGVDVYLRRLQTDPRSIPSASQTLSFTQDGPIIQTENPDVFRMHQELIGNSYPEDTLSEGKRAAKFFLKQFGFDFTTIDENVFLRGNVSMMDGAVSFSHFMVDPRGLYRVVTASNMFEATRFNNYISDGGWRIFFHRDVMSRGAVTGMVPKGAIAVYGNYGIRTGVHADATVKTKSDFPGPVLNIHYESMEFFPPIRRSGAAIDCNLYHDKLGPGTAAGILIPRIDDVEDITPDTYWTGGNVLRFPGSVPFDVLPTKYSSNRYS